MTHPMDSVPIPEPLFWKTEEIDPSRVTVKTEAIVSSLKCTVRTTCYTADQLRAERLSAYEKGRNEGLEEAAKKCKAWADDHAKHDGCNYVNCDYVAAATDCANEIRSLKR